MENGQKQVAALKSSKNWGDRWPQAGTEKQQHWWEKKGRLNFQTKEKTWNLRGRIIQHCLWGGVRSAPGATRFNILFYKQVLNVKITEISENVSELIPVVHTPLPITPTGGVGTGYGVTNNKMKRRKTPSRKLV
jgi:hypothetical protein